MIWFSDHDRSCTITNIKQHLAIAVEYCEMVYKVWQATAIWRIVRG
jgi:hypothetical protein